MKEKKWSEEDRELAQEGFDVLGRFFMKHCNDCPHSMLEACDYVSNYLGDIAQGREITIEKPEDVFPSLLKQAKLETLEAIIKEVEGMEKDPPSCMTPSDCETCGPDYHYNQALSDLLIKLQAQKELIENSK